MSRSDVARLSRNVKLESTKKHNILTKIGPDVLSFIFTLSLVMFTNSSPETVGLDRLD